MSIKAHHLGRVRLIEVVLVLLGPSCQALTIGRLVARRLLVHFARHVARVSRLSGEVSLMTLPRRSGSWCWRAKPHPYSHYDADDGRIQQPDAGYGLIRYIHSDRPLWIPLRSYLDKEVSVAIMRSKSGTCSQLQQWEKCSSTILSHIISPLSTASHPTAISACRPRRKLRIRQARSGD
jgi:hypothetical protein